MPPRVWTNHQCLHSFIYLFILKFNFFIDSLSVSCHTPQFCSASKHPISSTHPCSTARPRKTKQSKQANNQTKNKNKTTTKTSWLLLYHLSNTSSFILVSLGTSVSHNIPFYLSAFLACVHCNESLIWF